MDIQKIQNPKADILIVDDTLPNLRLLSTMLMSHGYEVREAPDGLTALALVDAQAPDLILLDIRMPGMDGFEVCQRLKENQRTRHIPIIFVSALDEQTDKVQGFSIGGVDYITKPLQVKEVIARVQTHLALHDLKNQLERQNARLQLEIQERQRAEAALRRANEELELRVKERTAELVEANQSLGNELGERKRVEGEKERLLAQVKEQAQQVREIMNTVPEGMLLLDSSGQIMLANPAALRDLQTLAGLQVGDNLNCLGDRPLAELLTSPPDGLRHEVKIASHIFEVIARPMVNGPEPQRWLIVMRDVTQERQIQQSVQQQERLAAVGQLAAGIAHDFNNILAVILLYTEMMLGSPELSSQLSSRLLTISRQARRATDLIQQILDFSRCAVLERRPMDLLPFLKEQVKLLERTLPENIRIDLDYQRGEYMIEADPTRLQQVIMNLAVNARDAMPEGGRLYIELAQLDQDVPERCAPRGHILEKRQWIRVTISDTGCGIPPDVLPHIFDPFFTTKAPAQGTGLGLAQVYGLIGQHEGHVDVHSQVGKGAAFYLYLPALSQTTPPPLDQDLASFSSGNGQTILLVEDEATTRQALVDGLTLLEYKVISAANGREALAALEQHSEEITLILSDVIMPEMGGVALLRAIRQRASNLPVILMTGHPMQEGFEDLKAEGLSAWVLKPLGLKQLSMSIAEALK